MILPLLFAAALQGGAPPAPASPPPDSLQAALQRLADSVLAARPRLPGLLIAVESKPLGRAWSVAAGLSDTARKVPLRPEQPVRLASNTKTYVAAALLRLVEEGRLSLGDPLARYLPPAINAMLQRDGYQTDVITIEQVMSHRAGFNEHPAVPSYAARLRTQPAYHWTPSEQLQWLVDSLAPVGAPGAQFRYSDSGYVLLGLIVERLTGRPLGPAVRTLVDFDRLGLRHTWWETLEPAPPGIADRAHQYLDGFDSHGISPTFDLYGGGGLVAPMSDLARFLAALRAIPAHAGPPPGQHNFGRGVPLITRDAAVRAALAALPDLVDVDRATAAWEAACHAPPWAEPPVWIHGDLTPGNLLVWQGHLHAAIDFGGLAVGDPACDLMVAWNLLDSATRPILRAHLAIDHASWLRGMGWALSMALIALPYYRHTNLPIVPLSFRVLDEILNDPNLRAELRTL